MKTYTKIMCDNCGAIHPHTFTDGVVLEVLVTDGWTRSPDLCPDCTRA